MPVGTGSLALANDARRLVAVHLRHLAIHEDQVVALLRGALAGDEAVLGKFHFAAELGQQAGREHAIDGMILDDQHAEAVTAPRTVASVGSSRASSLSTRLVLVDVPLR